MIKPKKLQRGDTVAIVSLSSGLAGEEEILHRTHRGIERLEHVFGLKVKVMPHALDGLKLIYEHPEWRAEDLNMAIRDPEVKAIICTIGGTDSIRLLPYIDVEAIKSNPKIFSGYSDITVLHMLFYALGMTSFYGPALLPDFAENNAMDTYTVQSIEAHWFDTTPVHKVLPSETIRRHGLRWEEQNQYTSRAHIPNTPYEVINGSGIASGHLIGGCLEVLSKLRGTTLFPEHNAFDGAVLFLETSETLMPEWLLEDNLRSLAAMGILQRVNAIIIGKPQNNHYYHEYIAVWRKILKEWHLTDLPVLYNMSFGHNEPKYILPYGVLAEVNADAGIFKIIEHGVI